MRLIRLESKIFFFIMSNSLPDHSRGGEIHLLLDLRLSKNDTVWLLCSEKSRLLKDFNSSIHHAGSRVEDASSMFF